MDYALTECVGRMPESLENQQDFVIPASPHSLSGYPVRGGCHMDQSTHQGSRTLVDWLDYKSPGMVIPRQRMAPPPPL